jgi:hypothetical protein
VTAMLEKPSRTDPPCYDFLMPTEHIVALLISKRDKLNRAIDALQGPTKRRGRPPRNPLAATTAPAAASIPVDGSPAAAKRKGRTFTAAQRKAFGERMKAYWAKRRKKKD